MKEIPLRDFNAASPEKLASILNGPPGDAAAWLYTAAEHGVVEAQVRYAHMLLAGTGVARNPEEAFQWFKLAAREGHPMAMNMVGRCYENGWGVEPQMLLAAYWFRMAALKGLDWGMYNYATSLALGRGVETARGEALAWLRKAADLGHAKSWNLLGGFYEDGWEMPVDLDAAFICYQKAAEGGDFRGQFNYARLLAGRSEMTQALEWLTRAHRSATAAFRTNMRRFLMRSDRLEFRTLLRHLDAQLCQS